MILVDVQRQGHEQTTFQLALAGSRELIGLMFVLEEAKSVKGFKVFQRGVQVSNLYEQFGLGSFSKFCPEKFDWSES